MKFDFDKVVDRHGTKCLKYDFAKERGRSDNMLPLWVADMDFPSPACAVEALKQYVSYPLGYFKTPESYYDAVIQWEKQRKYKSYQFLER